MPAVGAAVGSVVAAVGGTATALSVASVGLGVAGFALNVKSAKETKKANRAAQQREVVAANVRRRKAIRTAAIQRAQARASAEALGATEGTGLSGGLGSQSSQLSSNLGTSQQLSGLGQQISNFSESAGTYGAASNLLFTGSSLFGRLSNREPAQAPNPIDLLG